MDNEKRVDAYNKLLNAVLDYLQENEVLNYKQSNLIMQYVEQNDESKKLVKYKKINKILQEMNKILSNKPYVSIPMYSELKKHEGSGLRFSGDYFEQKEIHDMLKHRVDSRESRDNVYDFLKILISEVKIINESLIKEKQEDKLQTNDKQIVKEPTFNSAHDYNSRTNLSKSYERKEDVETKKRIEERNVNDLDTVKDIMLREEMAFDKALKKGYVSYFDLGESYTLDEKKRKEYLTEILNVATSQKCLLEKHKRLDKYAASYMIRNAEEIEDLIVQNLLEVNFEMSSSSELYKQTLLKPKYNPHRLLEQYKKLYERYIKQFDKLPDEEKRTIIEVCKIENNNIKFIPTPEDIITKINSRLQEKMIEYKVGIYPGDSGKLCGSYGLTTYMKPEQIATTEYLIKQKVEEIHKPKSVTQYVIEQEWKKAWRLNISGISKESIREDLEEQYRKENEAILKTRNKKVKNLQYNYSTAISAKENENRSLTEICREVLHEEPMFEEPKKEKESQALIEKDKVNGFSFKSIKAAIARALNNKER